VQNQFNPGRMATLFVKHTSAATHSELLCRIHERANGQTKTTRSLAIKSGLPHEAMRSERLSGEGGSAGRAEGCSPKAVAHLSLAPDNVTTSRTY